MESLLQELEFKSLSRRLLKREIELKKPKDSIKEPSKPIQASQKIGQMDLFSTENVMFFVTLKPPFSTRASWTYAAAVSTSQSRF